VIWQRRRPTSNSESNFRGEKRGDSISRIVKHFQTSQFHRKEKPKKDPSLENAVTQQW
jgi:hypothetical protein